MFWCRVRRIQCKGVLHILQIIVYANFESIRGEVVTNAEIDLHVPLGARDPEARLPFLLAHFTRDCAANLFKTGEVPAIWKIPALLRLDWLDGTVVSIQKYTFSVRLLG